MGCEASSVKVAAARERVRVKKEAMLPSKTVIVVPDGGDEEGLLRRSYEGITSNISSVASPPNMRAVVCFDNLTTFPILVAQYQTRDGVSIPLPVIAGSISRAGRLVCFSQLTFLLPKHLHVGKTMRFITRSINWVSDGLVEQTPIPVFCPSQELGACIAKQLKDAGMNPVVGCVDMDLSAARVVIITSDVDPVECELFEKLVMFSANGGGIAVFYNHIDGDFDESTKINGLLSRFGLGFTHALLNLDSQDLSPLPVPEEFSEVCDLNLDKAILSSMLTLTTDIEVDTLDKILLTLSQYMAIGQEKDIPKFSKLFHTLWSYLDQTKYNTPTELCPEVKQKMVAMSLLELYRVLPTRMVPPIPQASLFPGWMDGENVSDFTLCFDLPDAAWVSTGLYLPAHSVGVIYSSDKSPDVIIQIGCHTENLMHRDHWQRWPVITTACPLTAEMREVSSPFGGMVFIYSSDASTEGIAMKFEGFSEYPRYVVEDPGIWERTKNSECPWGEIETRHVIFSLPTPNLARVDCARIAQVYDTMMERVVGFLSSSVVHKARVVFDIDLALSGRGGYPIMKLIVDVPGILEKLEEPSVAVFDLLVDLAVAHIKENLFPPKVEELFGMLAAENALEAVFPSFNLEKLEIERPMLLAELRCIEKVRPGLVSKVLASFQSAEWQSVGSPEDNWWMFLRKLCIDGELNFVSYIANVCPFPINDIEPILKLPKFEPC